MKKHFNRLICIILSICFVMSCTGCTQQNSVSNDTQQTETSSTETGIVTTTTAVHHIETIPSDELVSVLTAKLVYQNTQNFDDMYFEDYTKSKLTPSDKGTAFTILITSTKQDVSLSQIETVAIKDADGGPVNFSTKTYMLNNYRAVLVFAKTEGEHKASEYATYIKTADGKEQLLPIDENEDKTVLENYTTPAGDAKFGDIINVKDRPYFVLQNGSVESVSNNTNAGISVTNSIGIVLVPLDDIYSASLTKDDFDIEFFDNENLGKGDVTTEITVNDQDTIKKYRDTYKGLYVEFVVCQFSLNFDGTERDAIAKRDYVMNNTWLKGTFDTDFLFKVYPKQLSL